MHVSVNSETRLELRYHLIRLLMSVELCNGRKMAEN